MLNMAGKRLDFLLDLHPPRLLGKPDDDSANNQIGQLLFLCIDNTEEKLPNP